MNACHTPDLVISHKLREHIENDIAPHLEKELVSLHEDMIVQIDLKLEETTVDIKYSRATQDGTGYISDKVILEFGALSLITPNIVICTQSVIF